jgi:hypothetical protein
MIVLPRLIELPVLFLRRFAVMLPELVPDVEVAQRPELFGEFLGVQFQDLVVEAQAVLFELG